MAESDWLDEHYKNVFEEEMRFLQRRRENDANLSIDDLKGQLKSLYSVQDADWEGRGQAGDAEMSATIAAYETFIGNLEKERRN